MNNRRVLLKSYVWGHIVSNRLASLLNSIKGRFKNLTLLGNSVQGENPAPDNPQEIKSAGRKSKNLFNIADLRVGQVQKDGTINEKSTRYRTATLDVPEDAKYRITFKTNTDYNMIYFTDAYINGVHSNPYVKVYGGNSGSLISLKNGKNILSFRATKDDATIDFPKDHNIMIAAESETLDYEPYGYLLDVKVTGENLLDMADIQNENGKIESNYGIAKSIKPFNIIKDRKYLLISKGTMIADVKYSSIYFGKDDLKYNQGHNNILSTDTGYSCFIGEETRKILTAKETCIITKTIIHGVNAAKDAYEVEELGLFEIINDNTNIDYQPYTEQSIQIVLNEPLRGIGEYKDTITKDGVVRKIYPPYEIDLNDLRDGGYLRTNTVMFSVKVQNRTVGYASLKPSIFCNIFPDCALQTSNIYNTDKECIAVGGGIILFRVNKSRLKDISSFESTKQSFIEFMADKKMIVEYALEIPITEPLPEFVQAQLSALHSENGTTHVFVDSGEVEAGISVTYKQKK